jgi:hypothetical protein
MDKYTDLIAQLEAAETRDEYVAAFQAIAEAKVIPAASTYFEFHLYEGATWAKHHNRRCFGYLLLAAMEMVPEGWHSSFVTESKDKKFWHWCLHDGSGMAEIEADGSHPCTALAAACLRAKEQSDGG